MPCVKENDLQQKVNFFTKFEKSARQDVQEGFESYDQIDESFLTLSLLNHTEWSII
jgi:hypothetical protein